MALKPVQQDGNEHRTVSFDSDQDTLPGGSGTSKWTDSIDYRGNFGGGRAADAQDGRQKQKMDARETQIELQELKMREGDPTNTTSASHDNPPKQYPGVMILEFIPRPWKGGQPSASQRGSQLLEKLRRRSSRFSVPIHPLTLGLLLRRMPPVQLAFIDKLDSELSKVESFFVKRVAEARERSLRLKKQLGELKDHRRLFHDAYPGAHHNTPLSFLPAHRSNASRGKKHEPQWSHDTSGFQTNERVRARNQKADAAQEFRLQRQPSTAKLPPEDYISARKKLKRAVAEHYSGLEVLNNYRILNLTGFRKALKKFEKVTGVPLQDVYMKEKVDLCSFASDQTVQALLKEAEDQFTTRFG
ncbi:SPX domain-containing protein [Lactarius hengduanensis]|nr:SPX domain-containing protein [Lactarius hengduanensis]